MRSIPFIRFFLAMLAAVIFMASTQGTALAQASAPAAPPPEKVKQMLDLLNDPEVKSWLEKRPVPAVVAEEETVATGLTSIEARVRDHIAKLKAAFVGFPQQLAHAASVTATDVNSGHPGTVFLILAVLIAVGYGAEWLFRRLLNSRRHETAGDDEAAAQPLLQLTQLIPLLVFALASVGLFLAFEWPPLLRKVVLTYLAAVILFRLVRTVARLVLAPAGSGPGQPVRMLDTDDASARFWYSRAQILAAIFLLGWAISSLMPPLGFTREARQLVSYAFGLGLLAVAIECVWRRPLFRQSPSPTRGWLLSFYLVILWLIWVAGFVNVLWLGLYALLLPGAISGVGKIADTLASRHGTTTLLGIVTRVLIVRGARALAITAAVAWLAFTWRLNATYLGENETMQRVVGGLLNGIIILLIADLLWQLSKALIAHRMEIVEQPGATPEETARRGRLRTLLPIFRNALAVFIGVVALLTILSGMGVAIAPLIAGAGIFGVAIGFGSQTLVKDVISGVFFMLDDAFRVGEYIQSGSYKGTVEGFSLRSVRLRHQRGPIFTVPFGSLGAVQNMSRDWVIEKTTLTVTYDSDVELARKLVKKIGQQLAEDPEFAASTLQPLKMQGVDSFGDLGIVLRMKLMTKPGQQFTIKRRALMMIKKAFDENGIKLATPTVQVAGGGDEGTAAAAQETRRRRMAAEAAAAGGEG